MKRFLTLLAALALAFAAQAATPRAAEDPSDPVVASDIPVPKVRREAPKPTPATIASQRGPAKLTKAGKPAARKGAQAAKGGKARNKKTKSARR